MGSILSVAQGRVFAKPMCPLDYVMSVFAQLITPFCQGLSALAQEPEGRKSERDPLGGCRFELQLFLGKLHGGHPTSDLRYFSKERLKGNLPVPLPHPTSLPDLTSLPPTTTSVTRAKTKGRRSEVLALGAKL